MPKNSKTLQTLPPEVIQALLDLGLRLRAYRLQARLTIADMAQKLLCSPVTYRALESGKASVSLGALASALWLLGQLPSLNQIAALPQDFARSLSAGKRVRRKAHEGVPGTLSEADRDF